jgi:hypothetical protein
MLIGIVLAGLAAAPAAAPPIPGDDAAVIGAFRTMCLERPNLAQIAAKAAAMGMKIKDDQAIPGAEGGMARHKTWTGDLEVGPFGLMVDENAGPKGKSSSCEIFGAAVSDPDIFRAEIARALNLPPASPPRLEGGARSFTWEGVAGPGTMLIVRDLGPVGKPGIMVKLVSRESGAP